MKIENAIASVAVKDLKAASAWYEKLFGRPADSTPMREVAEWKFERGGWLQVYELAERAGAGSCTLAVNHPGTPSSFLAEFKNYYGPTMNAFEAAEKSGRADDLQRNWRSSSKARIRAATKERR